MMKLLRWLFPLSVLYFLQYVGSESSKSCLGREKKVKDKKRKFGWLFWWISTVVTVECDDKCSIWWQIVAILQREGHLLWDKFSSSFVSQKHSISRWCLLQNEHQISKAYVLGIIHVSESTKLFLANVAFSLPFIDHAVQLAQWRVMHQHDCLLCESFSQQW